MLLHLMSLEEETTGEQSKAHRSPPPGRNSPSWALQTNEELVGPSSTTLAPSPWQLARVGESCIAHC